MDSGEVLPYIVEINVWHREFSEGLHQAQVNVLPGDCMTKASWGAYGKMQHPHFKKDGRNRFTFSILALELASSLIPIISWGLMCLPSVRCPIQRDTSANKK